MAKTQSLEVQQKKELLSKEEKTAPVRYYVPPADIYETDDALRVILEVPGVQKGQIDIQLEKDTLKIDAQIDVSKYEGHDPVYTEYNIGHFQRSFALSNRIDRDGISAELQDGVLILTLMKAKEAKARSIPLT